MAYVYQHRRLDTNKVFYVGIGDGVDYKRAYSKVDRNKWWRNIISKCEYRVEILKDNITWEEACKKERYYIKKYGRSINGGDLVNLTEGGEGFKCNHSNQTKQKISNTLSNKTYEEIHGKDKADIERKKRSQGVRKSWKSMSEKEIEDRKKRISVGIKEHYEKHPESKIQKRYQCPYCKKEGLGSGMYRWHFDNCRNK